MIKASLIRYRPPYCPAGSRCGHQRTLKVGPEKGVGQVGEQFGLSPAGGVPPHGHPA
jgi:hypothetical protein